MLVGEIFWSHFVSISTFFYIMHLLRFIPRGLCLLAAVGIGTATPEEAAKLFDGKTLTGWKAAKVALVNTSFIAMPQPHWTASKWA